MDQYPSCWGMNNIQNATEGKYNSSLRSHMILSLSCEKHIYYILLDNRTVCSRFRLLLTNRNAHEKAFLRNQYTILSAISTSVHASPRWNRKPIEWNRTKQNDDIRNGHSWKSSSTYIYDCGPLVLLMMDDNHTKYFMLKWFRAKRQLKYKFEGVSRVGHEIPLPL